MAENIKTQSQTVTGRRSCKQAKYSKLDFKMKEKQNEISELVKTKKLQ